MRRHDLTTTLSKCTMRREASQQSARMHAGQWSPSNPVRLDPVRVPPRRSVEFGRDSTLVVLPAVGVLYKPILVKRASQPATLAFKALGEPRRVEILRLLRRGPRAVGEIAAEVDVSQQATSQHLAVLGKAGLVEARREGTRRLYAIKPEGFAPVAAFVEGFWAPRLTALKDVVEKKR
jgi:DNA-binding transcriptional ArsR family regulator